MYGADVSVSYGGQAVLEGVMMRGPSCWAVAVRTPEGGIEEVVRDVTSPMKRHRVWRLPVIRGVIALGESLAIGFRALAISANVAAHDRDVAVALGPAGNLSHHGLDAAVETARRNRPMRRPAHHHAFEHGLAAHVALLVARSLGHGAYDFFFCLATRRWNRSTRPPVSTSFCLPV